MVTDVGNLASLQRGEHPLLFCCALARPNREAAVMALLRVPSITGDCVFKR